jgi:hypothetical protein
VTIPSAEIKAAAREAADRLVGRALAAHGRIVVVPAPAPPFVLRTDEEYIAAMKAELVGAERLFEPPGVSGYERE